MPIYCWCLSCPVSPALLFHTYKCWLYLTRWRIDICPSFFQIVFNGILSSRVFLPLITAAPTGLANIMANSTDWDELVWAWKGFRDAVGVPNKPLYKKFVKLANEAAVANGENYYKSRELMERLFVTCGRSWFCCNECFAVAAVVFSTVLTDSRHRHSNCYCCGWLTYQ